MAVKFSNNFSTVLVSSISSSATVIELQSVSGLPTLAAGDHTYLTFDTDTNSPTIEIVKVTAINAGTNEITVVRGQDNTSASAFAAGTAVELRMCAILLSEFLQEDGDGSNLTDVRAETVEVNVKNVSGGSLAKGTPVHQTGTAGAATFEVVAADASNAAVMPAHFVLLETLADEEEGRGLLMGRISGVDTSAFSEGDTIYVAVGGGYTNTAPTGEGNLIQNLGTVTRVDATNGGGEVMGAGRSAATPNLNDGNIFLGNASNQAVTASLSTSVSNLSHYNNANWDTAYGWGDHASAGYQAASTALTTSTTFGGDVSGTYNAIVVANDSHTHDTRYYTESEIGTFFAGTTAITGYNKSNWDTAYGWGNHASAGYLTGNQTITLTGDVSGSGTTSISVTIADDSHNHIIGNVDGLQAALDGKTAPPSSNDTFNGTYPLVWVASDVLYSSTFMTINGATDTLSVPNISISGTLNGGTPWHSANDGSGSGLDADLLDGVQATGFMRQLSDASSPNYTTPSSRRVDPNSSNPTNAHHAIVTFGNDGNVTGQLATHFVSGQPYTRGYNNAWSSWRTIWTDANDGSGSGLDADTVDGVQSSSFIRSDVADSFGAQLSSANNVAIRFVAPNATDENDGKIGAGTFASGLNIVGAQTSAGTGRQVRIWGDVITSGGNAFWHSGNDGSGSGLDADLLDGNHASAFLTSTNDRVYITDSRGAQRAPSYYDDKYVQWDFQNISDTGAGGDGWHVLQTVSPWSSYNDAHRQQQLVFTGSGGLKFRYASSDSAWTGWQTLWTSANDGSGSGLDADLLDGLQLHTGRNNESNKVVRTDGDGYIQAGWINTPSGDRGTTAPDRIYASNDAYLRYYTPTNFRNLLGLWWSGNDGSGSGLDADVLDGVQASQFLRSDTADTAAGKITFNTGIARGNHHVGHLEGSYNNVGANSANTNPIYTIGSAYNPSATSVSGMYGVGYAHPNLWGSGKSNGWGMYVVENGVIHTTLSIGGLWSKGSIFSDTQGTLWGTSNDGSGSGLDADTCDGQHLGTSSSVSFSKAQAAGIGVSNTSDTSKIGISLYNGHGESTNPTYGIMFTGTPGSGTFGDVTGNWATYFTMNSSSGRGWIFRENSTGSNVASISNRGYLTAQRLYAGDGNDGFFYSDINGRTAFASGDFYIQPSVSNFYNYATNQYYGDSSGDNILFRGNTLSGNSWSLTGGGAFTTGGTIDVNGGFSGIDLTGSSIISSATSGWTGNPGANGKIQYHANRWYIVADSNSNRIVQFRQDGTDKSYIDNNGTLVGGGMWSSYNDGSGSGGDGHRDHGVYGNYNSYRIHHMWSMGTSYRINASGADFGNLHPQRGIHRLPHGGDARC
jgi:hypothetical protein